MTEGWRQDELAPPQPGPSMPPYGSPSQQFHGWPEPVAPPATSEPHGVPVTICTGTPIRARYRSLIQLLEAGPLSVDIRLADEGQSVVYLPRGAVRLSFASQYWFSRVGRASINLDTSTGPQTIYYVAPYTIWSSGIAGLGPLPAKRPGGQHLVWILGAVAAVVILVNVVLFVLTQQ